MALKHPSGISPQRNNPFINTPMSAPGGAGANAGGGGGGFGGPRLPQNIILPWKYGRVTQAFYAMAVNSSQLLLEEPEYTRTFIMVRNSAGSAGTLGMSFNSEPTSIELAAFELGPGDVLLLDDFVPQNRIFGVAYNGACNVTVVYCNVGS